MKYACFLGLSWDRRFREATAALIQSGGGVVSQHELLSHVTTHGHRGRMLSIAAAIESRDCVDIENFRFTRIDEDNWLVERAWDVERAIARCEPMRKALEHLAVSGAVDIADETIRKAFWEQWQAEYTDWYHALPPASKELWDENDFPLEPYESGKAHQVFSRLQAWFGPKPRLTNELCFWFRSTAEALPPAK